MWAILFSTAGCASHNRAPSSPRASAAPEPSSRAPVDVGAALARLRHQHSARHAAMQDARSVIDRRGLFAECERYRGAAATRRLGPYTGPAYVWCLARREQWEDVLEHAPRAIAFYEVAGELRRLAEMHLLGAIAASATAHDELHRRHLTRSTRLRDVASIPLIAAADDPYAGDLPYLLARASEQPTGINPRQDRSLSVPALFELARAEYQSAGRSEALPHVWRDQAQYHIRQGEPGAAATAITQALTSDLAAGPPSGGTLHDLLTLIALTEQIGCAQVTDAIIEWIHLHGFGDWMRRQVLAVELPTSHTDLAATIRQPGGSTALLRGVRAVRRDLQRAIRPPVKVMTFFKELRDLDALGPTSYVLATEVGSMLAEHGHRHAARRYFAWAVAAIERLRRKIPDLRQRQRFLATHRPTYMALLHAYVGIDTARLTQRDYRAALAVAGALKARGLLDVLSEEDPPGLTTRDEHLIQEATALADASAPVFAGHLTKLLSRWASAPTPTSPPLKRGVSASAPDVLAAARAPTGGAIIEYMIGERSGYLWVIDDAGTIAMRRVAGRDELMPLFVAFRRTLVDHSWDAEQEKEHRRLAERLYVELIGPAEDLLIGRTHLVIAPDDFLHDLAMSALARPSDRSVPEYLIEDHILSFVPSSRAAQALARRDVSVQRPGRALLLGNPHLEESARELLARSRDSTARDDTVLPISSLFPSLPGSAVELDNIHRALRGHRGISGVERRTEAAATEAALVRAATESYAVVHIAAHGVSDAPSWRQGEVPIVTEQPALLLASDPATQEDGILDLAEIASLEWAARLVVLSGCTTGRGWRTLGDGAYGLAGAFLSAGAHRVVASLWSVSDAATTSLMSQMYRRLGADLDAARALRAAQRALLHRPAQGRPYTPPFYWAAWRVIGYGDR